MSELYLIDDLFNTLIGLEEFGQKTYQDLAENSDDLRVQKLFKMLAEQEAGHKKYYLELKEKFNTTRDVDDEYKKYLNVLIKNSFFKTTSSENINKISDALSLGIALEKETLLFLSETQNVLGEISYEVFEKVKDEERRHLALLLDLSEQI